MLVRKLLKLLYINLLLTTIVLAQPPNINDSLEARLARLEQQLTNLRQTILDHEMTISQLQREVQNLRGEKEVLLHTLEQVKKQQEDIFSDLDQRLRDLQGGHTTSATAASEQTTTPNSTDSAESIPPEQQITPASKPSANTSSKLVGPTPPPAKPTEFTSKPESTTDLGTAISSESLGGDEKQDYQKIYKLVQSGNYDKAITGFEAFLKRYPQGQYADNAQYWLGEAQYALKQYSLALATFKALREQSPNGQKSAHALLKIGYIYYEQKKYADAKTTLKQVKETYPDTATARLAEERLQQMYREGK